jgi:hypothetical protein
MTDWNCRARFFGSELGICDRSLASSMNACVKLTKRSLRVQYRELSCVLLDNLDIPSTRPEGLSRIDYDAGQSVL